MTDLENINMYRMTDEHSADKMKFLITGASGFVGKTLTKHLLDGGHTVRGTLLPGESASNLTCGVASTVVGPLGQSTCWLHALSDIDTVIHLAARVHVMDDQSTNPLLEYRRVNVEGIRRLAHDAVKAGVKRFIFVSSIKVNGEESDIPYHADSLYNPQNPYAVSKMEAEQNLRRIGDETGLEVVIVRPPLVYGPGVKANFLRMMQVVQQGLPLPLSSIHNRRSLIYVGNLADALLTCATHSKATGKTFLVSDSEDVSTPELVRRTAAAMGIPARLFPFPVSFMKVAGKLTGKSGAVHRLTGSLTVDSSKIRQELDWKPPFTMCEGLRATAEWFKENAR
ncbi:MAG: UDP-glucose 4-epimerase family protein [Desulfobacter sp.]